MKTVGSMLRDARLSRGIQFADAERATKIREKFLRAIESDDFSTLPSPSYAKGFVRNYARFLGLPADHIMAFFRRQTADVTRSSLLPRGVADPLDRKGVRLTPGRFIAIMVALLTAAFMGYLGFQYVRIGKSPPLVVTSPSDNTLVSERRIVVEGQTDPDATVTINGVSAIVRDDGRFYDRIAVDGGVNTITVVATSRFGKTATVIRQIGFAP